MVRTIAERIITLWLWNAIIHIPEERILVCQECRVAVPAKLLGSHLKNSHRLVPAKRRREIESRLIDLPVVQTWADVSPRPDYSVPLSYLQDPLAGFYCPHCSQFKTISEHTIRQHRSSYHSHRNSQFDINRVKCFLQTWSNRNAYRKYWKVDTGEIPHGTSSRIATATDSQTSRVRSLLPKPIGYEPPTSEFADICEAEAEEERRLLNEHDDAPALAQELEQDENTEWLRACEWPRWFAHRSLALIVTAARLPCHQQYDFVLGNWHGVDCISPTTDERIILRIVTATHLVFARCEETLQNTPRTLRCWLRSWSSLYLPYPFEMVERMATKRRYYRYFQQFLCYIYRVWRLGVRLKERTLDLTGLHLTTAQTGMMQNVWTGFASLPRDIELRSAGAVPEQSAKELAILIENLFQLIMMFWTDLSTNGSFCRNAIVHFSGVLGIHPYELAYRGAYDYTPFLSALIWVGRLCILEYGLPLYAYQHLTYPWPDRGHYKDQFQRLQQIRTKYLLRGSLSPIGYLIERLRHGRATARHRGPRTNISWSIDGQVLQIGDDQITMSQFRGVIHATVVRARQQTHDLLFGWHPSISLESYHEDLINRRPGYSFLSHPQNDFQDSFRVLSRKAFSREGGFSLSRREGRERARKYLRSCDRLVGLLYGGIHLTYGMPGRCEELRFIRWANTGKVMRNVFLYHGQLILIFEYNKATKNHNNSFYVVRVPCPAIQQILFIYLVYIRPFRDFLARHLGILSKDTTTNPHLFCVSNDSESCFSAPVCRSRLQKSTEGSPIQVGTARYRQITVSIAKRHLTGAHSTIQSIYAV